MKVKLERLRAYLLDKGDAFLLNGAEYRVRKIKEGIIHYCKVYDGVDSGVCMTMSAHSSQRIELIVTNKLKICQAQEQQSSSLQQSTEHQDQEQLSQPEL